MTHANGWRPIETAPTDRTPVLAVVAFSKHPIVAYCFLGQWRSAWDGTPLDDDFYAAPTMWQPLPAPPPQQEGAGDE